MSDLNRHSANKIKKEGRKADAGKKGKAEKENRA
jgi:hypothetical protein